MALSRKVGCFLSSTSTGNQVITGLGFQPKLVLFYGCLTPEAGTTTSQYVMLGAATSSTERWVISASAITAQTAANNSRSFHSDACIFQVDATETTAYKADLVSMDADGFTLNWGTANATARYVHFVALGGSDLSAKAGKFTKNNSTGNQSVTGVGFQPGCVLFGASVAGTADAVQASSFLVFGHAVSSTDRYVSQFFGVDAADPMDEQRVTYDNACYASINATPALLERMDYVSHDADGFTVNNVSTTQSLVVGYVALGGTARFKGGTLTAPTEPKTLAKTGVGFSPEVVLFHSIGSSAALNTLNSTFSVFAFSALDKAGNNTGYTTLAQSAVGTSVSSRHQDLGKCLCNSSTATGIDSAAFLWGTGSDGFTLRFTPAVPAGAFNSVFLAISGASDTAEYTFPVVTVNTGVHYEVDPAQAAPTTAAVIAPYRGYAAWPATYTVSGTVQEGGVGVARVVRAYRRDTGEFVGETTSAGDGTFSLASAHAGNHPLYVIALDALGVAPDYNAQIFDLVVPG